MIRVNIKEAKTHLSRYLRRLAQGETTVVRKRDVPVAELNPIPRPRISRRPIGIDRGKLEIPPSFYEPLPPQMAETFGETPPNDR